MLRRTGLVAGLLSLVAPLSVPAQDSPLRMELVYRGEDHRTPDIRLVTPSDGYLLLLHVSGGHAQVMFPGKPGASAALASGEYNLDRLDATFPFSGRREGIIVAAWSESPIRTSEFVRYGHWAISDLSRQAFLEDPAEATVALATRLGATPGVAVAVEYGPVARSMAGGSENVAIRRIGRDGSDNYDWLVYQNLARIQGICPSGTRDVTGAREVCSPPPPPPRERSLRPVTTLPTSAPVERPSRPVYSPPPANPPPSIAPTQPATPPPTSGGKKPL